MTGPATLTDAPKVQDRMLTDGCWSEKCPHHTSLSENTAPLLLKNLKTKKHNFKFGIFYDVICPNSHLTSIVLITKNLNVIEMFSSFWKTMFTFPEQYRAICKPLN